jgi:phosphoesterase RecJ-like protein
MLDWGRFAREIESAERVLVTTHVRPDADALGSELGMAALLAAAGKDLTIFNASPTPTRYRFLDPEGDRIDFLRPGVTAPPSQPDLIIVVDTGTWSQLAGLADWVRNSPAKRLVVDHHVTQDDLGGPALVDVSAPACGILVYEGFVARGTPISPDTADALFAAIAMDTGWMHHPNTNSRALDALARLTDAGARPADIYRELFERNSPGRYRLMGRLFEAIQLGEEGRLAEATITLGDVQRAGAHMMDTEDFVQLLMGVVGVESAALCFVQVGGGTKVSLRSRGGVDCAALAARFGGGGHKPAAGATMKGDAPESARRKILAALVEEMRAIRAAA